jgi:hypothetical protein
MSDLTEDSLLAAIAELQRLIAKTGETIALKPTKVMYRPAELAALGLTHDDVVKMIRENT